MFANVVRPTEIAFDSAGRLYVANFGNTIERFAADGTPLGTFAHTGLNNPEGLAFDSLGYLYAANSAANTIEVFGPDGTDSGSVAASGFNAPVGLGFDSADSLYVVSAGSTTVEKITPGGSATIFAFTGFSPTFIAIKRTAILGDGTSTLVNISTRLRVLTGDNVLDGGFIITGTGNKRCSFAVSDRRSPVPASRALWPTDHRTAQRHDERHHREQRQLEKQPAGQNRRHRPGADQRFRSRARDHPRAGRLHRDRA